jgi:hypothetical protein
MRGPIMRPKVRFDFHDPANTLNPARHMYEVMPEQILSDSHGVPIIERARQGSHEIIRFRLRDSRSVSPGLSGHLLIKIQDLTPYLCALIPMRFAIL